MKLSAKLLVGTYYAAILVGCGQTMPGAAASKAAGGGPSVVVRDPYDQWKVTLSAKQAQWFVNDISGRGVESRISKYPAAAIAVFEYGGKEYLMHGNAVIHVDAQGKELLWKGPYLQALILEGAAISRSIAAVEKLKNLNGVTMEAPGAYPGGGGAPLKEGSAGKEVSAATK